MTMQNDIADIKAEQTEMKKEIKELRREQAEMKKEIKELRKEQTEIKETMSLEIEDISLNHRIIFKNLSVTMNALDLKMTTDV